jgi:ABC-type antimicrobial peptide transport system permease subunit
MTDRLHEAFDPFKLIATMLVCFGGLALLLAALGVYGVVEFSVSQRTREIGIRAALGADRSRLLILFLRQGFALLLIGIIPGTLASFAVTRAISAMLSDVVAIAVGAPVTGSVVVLALSVMLATLLPAWRGATTDPLTAIRHE